MFPPRMRHHSTKRLGMKLSLVAILVAVAASSAPVMAEDTLPYKKALPSPAAPVEPSEPDRPPPLLDEQLQAVPILGPTYIGVETKVTTLVERAGLLIGGQAGWIAEPQLQIGLAGYGLVSATSVPERAGAPASLQLAYGGLRSSFLVLPKSRFHLVLSGLAGIAGVGTAGRDSAAGAIEQRSSPVLLALEPEVEAEMNVGAQWRLAASISYRYLTNPEVPGLDSAAVSGIAGGFAVKVGTF